MNVLYSRTYEIIDLDNPPIQAGESHTHWIYFCPNCALKRGRPDRDGKLYYSFEKNVGYCFKCNTVFYPKVDENKLVDHEYNLALNNMINKLNDNNYPSPSEIKYDFQPLNLEAREYLKSRHMFLNILSNYLNLRLWNGTTMGIVTPFYIDNKIAKFQVRFNTEDHKKRYYTSPGEKLLYSPMKLFNDYKLKSEPTITLVEGTYDAIAAMILGYPNPVAVLGSSLSHYQLYLLRKCLVENAYVMMDDAEISYSLFKPLRKSVPSISHLKCVKYKEKDPEEILKRNLKNPDNLNKYLKIVSEIINGKV